jgi:ribosomal protein L32E
MRLTAEKMRERLQKRCEAIEVGYESSNKARKRSSCCTA